VALYGYRLVWVRVHLLRVPEAGKLLVASQEDVAFAHIRVGKVKGVRSSQIRLGSQTLLGRCFQPGR